MSPTTAKKRATAKTAKPKKRRYGHCLNCGTRYEKTKPNKKFCKPACKDEWHNSGGVSFARFSATVEARVMKAERKLRAELQASVSKEAKQIRQDANATIRRKLGAITKILRALKVPRELIESLTSLREEETTTGPEPPKEDPRADVH